MPKRRNFRVGRMYHIYCRGIKKENIFHDFQDYYFFIRRLARFKSEYKDKLLQYCVMPNHYHLMIKAASTVTISKLMQRLGTSYSRYYKKKYFHSGYLFQSRFNSKFINSEEYLLYLSRYIHQNPLSLEEIDLHNLGTYHWSSFPKYINPTKYSLVKIYPKCIMSYFNSIKEYEEFCLSSDLEAKTWIRDLVQRRGLI